MAERKFLITLLKKTLVMIGFTYFSVAVTTQDFKMILPPLISGGAYFFTEMFRYYRVNSCNKVLRKKKKKTIKLEFLI